MKRRINNSHVGAILFWIMTAIIGILLIIAAIADAVSNLRPADPESLPADIPTAGIGRTLDSAEAGIYLGDCCREEPVVAHRIETYTEWEGVVPEWYRPWEAMSAEWREIKRFDAGCPDWNVDSTLYGWGGRTMEAWEMDVFSRVMYLEFWGTSPECCEAGADAILRLWESGYYGPTMYGVLSAETETGGPVFETWDAVWGTVYDPDGLAEMRRLCEERFQSGPVWIAPFFRTGHYHEWAVPCYEIDGVYFSTGKGWN